MIATLIGIVFALIVLGVIWWGVLQLYPLIAQYIGEPFATIIRVLLVIIMVLIVLYVIAQLLAAAGYAPRWHFATALALGTPTILRY